MKPLVNILKCCLIVLEEYFVPLLILTVRLWMAKVLIDSGLSKVLGWSSTSLLFLYEYRLPLFGSVFWAVLSTATDFVSALLIGLGFLTRLASFQMLVVTTIVYLTYNQFTEYYPWFIALSILVLFGSGFFSVDSMRKSETSRTYPAT
ncbi:DoxX family protein [Neorickettsia helminthoeca]|nr:DoxX family protein [Neorickettsia helminthoeca]